MTAMIPQEPTNQQQSRWQDALKTVFTDPQTLLSYLEIPLSSVPWAHSHTFALKVSQSYASRMKKGDPNDPLLKQVLSVNLESQQNSNFVTDPLQEQNPRYNPLPGLLHKYSSRVLLTFAPSCAVNCRYCFRRHFPYQENQVGRKDWTPILEYIAKHPDIIEVILSGGDPLMATNNTLGLFIKELENISHVQFLRLHTRFPIAIPERIDQDFAEKLGSSRLKTTLVYHCNHANELTSDIAQGVKLLHTHGITVLNQSVLLKGVNDSVDSLANLSIKLFQSGILPYYLHLLDPISGAEHFDLPENDIKALQDALRATLPGYLMPRFVREIAGATSKVPF